jgi:hypothetical protein
MGFLVTDQTGGNFNLALADGGVLPVQGASGSSGTAGAAAYTPNTEQSFGPITPGGSAVVLAVADITPKASGLLSIKATVAVSSSVPDALNLALFAVAPLTAITGGTLVGQGITEDPTSTTPAFGGAPIMSTLGVESTTGGDLAGVTITGTYQAVAGQRTGIVLTGLSAVGGATTWVVGFSFEVIEQPSGTGASGPGTVQSVTAAAPTVSGIVVTNPTTNPTLAFAPGFAPPSLTFLNNAALTAYNVATPTALVQGQRAVVLSNGGVWTFKLVSALAVGNTVLAATGVAGAQWVRDGQTNIPNALKQTAWFVDAQNVSGTASDENDGLTSATALLNKREIFRRWGWTWSPNLVSIQVVITYLSADPAGGTDPGLFTPNFIGAASLMHTAALPASSFTGTLLAVTAKNTGAGNTALRSTFTTATGAMAVGLLLVNATRGNSRAFAQRNTGGGLWQITQPFTPYGGAATPPAMTEVDTWANGDAITGYSLLQVDLAVMAGQTADISSSVANYSHVAWQIDLFTPNALPSVQTALVGGQALIAMAECSATRNVSFQLLGVIAGDIYNCFMRNALTVRGGSRALGPTISGGAVVGPASILQDCFLTKDLILVGGASVATAAILAGALRQNGNVCIDSGVYELDGNLFLVAPGVIYGGGTLNVRGVMLYSGLAVTAFRVATLNLAGVATGYSNVTAAGVVTTHGAIALSAANLDAAAGAAGFGGYAYGGGGTFSAAGIQP